jgi:hypothetical protein
MNFVMRVHFATLFVALFVCSPILAQSTSSGTTAEVNVVKKAALRALNFKQGNLASLADARDDFTPAGWNEFLKRLDGFLDEKGAPTFTSSFVPSADAVMENENGVIRLRIPDTLIQRHDNSSTTYKLEVNVEASTNPVKIERLEQIIRLRH